MKLIRKIIVKLLGLKGYIAFVSYIYIKLVTNGFLKKQYPELFFLKTLVKPGDVCIDIGANVGYYSLFLSKITGKSGKVLAVEPVPMFTELWKKNTRHSHLKNLELLPYALGAENKTVQMGIPEKNGVVHHGMTKITSTADEHYVKYFEVEMRNPDQLFENLEKLNFIKCDVEGYERYVFANLVKTISKHKPLIQSELSGAENRKEVITLLEGMGYKAHLLQNEGLVLASVTDKLQVEKDFYFIPA